LDGAMTRQEAAANVAANTGSIAVVKRLFAWLAGAAGGLAAYRAVRGKPSRPQPVSDNRAEELKARLQQAREAGDDRDAFEAGEVPVDRAEPPEAGPLDPELLDPALLDPGARRAQVHEQGRAALDEMRGEQSS
jgi:hypothetical protein